MAAWVGVIVWHNLYPIMKSGHIILFRHLCKRNSNDFPLNKFPTLSPQWQRYLLLWRSDKEWRVGRQVDLMFLPISHSPLPSCGNGVASEPEMAQSEVAIQASGQGDGRAGALINCQQWARGTVVVYDYILSSVWTYRKGVMCTFVRRTAGGLCPTDHIMKRTYCPEMEWWL